MDKPLASDNVRRANRDFLALLAKRLPRRQTDAIERLRDRADALTTRAAALRRLADAEKPLYQSLDEAQKRRFGVFSRFAARWHRMAEAHTHGEGTPEHAQ
jgi:hypothetical protein